jgi:hypothetical protein
VAEGTRLLSEYGGKPLSRVRIPPSPSVCLFVPPLPRHRAVGQRSRRRATHSRALPSACNPQPWSACTPQPWSACTPQPWWALGHAAGASTRTTTSGRVRPATLGDLAPVAQLDRASVYGTEGRGFEFLRARYRKLQQRRGFWSVSLADRRAGWGAANGREQPSTRRRREDEANGSVTRLGGGSMKDVAARQRELGLELEWGASLEGRLAVPVVEPALLDQVCPGHVRLAPSDGLYGDLAACADSLSEPAVS